MESFLINTMWDFNKERRLTLPSGASLINVDIWMGSKKVFCEK